MRFLEYFETQFGSVATIRERGYRELFRILEEMNRREYILVETGSIRLTDRERSSQTPATVRLQKEAPETGLTEWADGQSTRMFDAFCMAMNGTLTSIDIDPEAIALVRRAVSMCTVPVLGDSISVLSKLARNLDQGRIDLLYLDSGDINWDDVSVIQERRMMEVAAIAPKLREGSLIVIDDNDCDSRLGAGDMVGEFMNKIGAREVYRDFQVIWEWP